MVGLESNQYSKQNPDSQAYVGIPQHSPEIQRQQSAEKMEHEYVSSVQTGNQQLTKLSYAKSSKWQFIKKLPRVTIVLLILCAALSLGLFAFCIYQFYQRGQKGKEFSEGIICTFNNEQLKYFQGITNESNAPDEIPELLPRTEQFELRHILYGYLVLLVFFSLFVWDAIIKENFISLVSSAVVGIAVTIRMIYYTTMYRVDGQRELDDECIVRDKDGNLDIDTLDQCLTVRSASSAISTNQTDGDHQAYVNQLGECLENAWSDDIDKYASRAIAVAVALTVVLIVTLSLKYLTWKQLGWRMYSKFGGDMRIKNMEKMQKIHYMINRFSALCKLTAMFVIIVLAVAFSVSIDALGRTGTPRSLIDSKIPPELECSNRLNFESPDYQACTNCAKLENVWVAYVLMTFTVVAAALQLAWCFLSFQVTKQYLQRLVKIMIGIGAVLIIPTAIQVWLIVGQLDINDLQAKDSFTAAQQEQVGEFNNKFLKTNCSVANAKESIALAAVPLVILIVTTCIMMLRMIKIFDQLGVYSSDFNINNDQTNPEVHPALVPLMMGDWAHKPSYSKQRRRRFFQLSTDYATLRWGWKQYIHMFHVVEIQENPSMMELTLVLFEDESLVMRFTNENQYQVWRKGFTWCMQGLESYLPRLSTTEAHEKPYQGVAGATGVHGQQKDGVVGRTLAALFGRADGSSIGSPQVNQQYQSPQAAMDRSIGGSLQAGMIEMTPMQKQQNDKKIIRSVLETLMNMQKELDSPPTESTNLISPNTRTSGQATPPHSPQHAATTAPPHPQTTSLSSLFTDEMDATQSAQFWKELRSKIQPNPDSKPTEDSRLQHDVLDVMEDVLLVGGRGGASGPPPPRAGPPAPPRGAMRGVLGGGQESSDGKGEGGAPITLGAPVTLGGWLPEKGEGGGGADAMESDDGELPMIGIERIPWNRLQMGKYLGRGGESSVYAALYNQTVVAIKEIRQSHEIHIYARAGSHDNIVQLRGVCTNSDNTRKFLVMEYCPRGNLDVYLHNSQTSSREQGVVPILNITRQIARGMLHLHSRTPPIQHRDLKPGNIFISHGFWFKIGDFGQSALLPSTPVSSSAAQHASSAIGTAVYAAPERFIDEHTANLDKETMLKADVYSFGVTLYEILTRKRPFEDKIPEQISYQWWNTPNEMELPPIHVSEHQPNSVTLKELAKLVKYCTQIDPRQRPNFDQIITIVRELLEGVRGGEGGGGKGGGRGDIL